jgi:hypothetical protein
MEQSVPVLETIEQSAPVLETMEPTRTQISGGIAFSKEVPVRTFRELTSQNDLKSLRIQLPSFVRQDLVWKSTSRPSNIVAKITKIIKNA